MKKILILTVGGSPDPLIHAIEQNHPDHVYCICTRGTEKTGSEYLVPEIIEKTQYDEAKVGTYPIATDDLNEVILTCMEIERDIQQNHASAKVYANYTGGTKTMALGLGCYAIHQQLNKKEWVLQINHADRKNLVKVELGDKAKRMDASAMIAAAMLSNVELFETQHLYDGGLLYIERIFQDTTFDGTVEKAIEEKYNLLQMYSCADRFDFSHAEQFADRKKDKERYRKLQRISTLFTGEPSAPWGPKDVSGHELVEDLIANAQRCEERQRYDDAVCRLYRATELIAQIKLLRDYGLRTGDIDLQNPQIPEETKERWIKSHRGRNGKIQIGLMDNFTLLAEMGDPLGKYASETLEDLKKCIAHRNDSLFAHGFTPIDKEKWNAIGKGWIEWLQKALEWVKR